jgi:caffeoyl-CoA O-methyltransferase
VHERLARYVTDLFAPEDAALAAVRRRHAQAGLPDILISADEGKLLHVLLRAVGAVRVLEVGTLGGYSGVWLARALPPHGRLTTIERDPRHAAVAREAFALAGVADRVALIEGTALDLLPSLAPGFDAVFLDADKEGYPEYARWAAQNLRPGGILLGDNAYYFGDLLKDTAGGRAMRRFHEELPAGFDSVCIPTPDGLVLAIKR